MAVAWGDRGGEKKERKWLTAERSAQRNIWKVCLSFVAS
jgi:hypothetical protein